MRWNPRRQEESRQPRGGAPVAAAAAGRPAPRVFSDFLHSLDPAGSPPGDRELTEVLRALRRAVEVEIRRRGLWESPPSFLGAYGFESWQAGGGEALEDLLTECYTFIFIDRLGALRDQLRVKENIEGLVKLNIRHFLHERQRCHDPLGFRVFESVRKAIRAALEAGEMRILAGDPRVRNETVLGFGRGGEAPAPPVQLDLTPVVRRWNDELLPDLVTAQGRGRQSVLAILQRLLQQLGAEGVEALRFKDLIDPFKEDVRARWAAILEAEPGETGPGKEGGGDPRSLMTLLRPDRSLEAADTFHQLVGCISDLVARLSASDRTREQLGVLWMYVRTSAAEEGREEKLPSYRKLGGLLGLPRERLPELYRLLQRLASQCQAAISGKIAVIKGQGLDGGGGPRGGTR